MPTDCIAVDFETEWYRKWAAILDYPLARHPKFWETAAIAEALEERGMLAPGNRGLGMGVGTEQLPSLFARQGVFVTATDQDPDEGTAQGWDNGQLAHGPTSLFYSYIVDRISFDERVRYEPYDMTKLKEEFVGSYDFVWHNCAIGHLGSLAASVVQLKRSARYLKDGGWLVFTTELNISSFDKTIDRDASTCVWRLKDLRRLFADLERVGLNADRLTLRLGDSTEDLRVNYTLKHNMYARPREEMENRDDCEIKIPLGPFAITQVLLCFQKTGRRSLRKSLQHSSDARTNANVVREFAKRSEDVGDYFENPATAKYSGARLVPDQKNLDVTMVAGGAAEVVLRFRNESGMRIFDNSANSPYNRSKVDVGTWDAADRASVFADPSWHAPNRPALSFPTPEPRPLTEWDSGFNPHRAAPDESFEYRFILRAPETPGRYRESFALVFEGIAWLPSSAVIVTVDVVGSAG
jgi:SAM-dependent methyltransferase